MKKHSIAAISVPIIKELRTLSKSIESLGIPVKNSGINRNDNFIWISKAPGRRFSVYKRLNR